MSGTDMYLTCICVCVCVCWLLSCVWLFSTLWTVAHRASLFMGILQARMLEWVAMPSSWGSSQPRDWTQVSHVAGGSFIIWATKEAFTVSERNSVSIFRAEEWYGMTRDLKGSIWLLWCVSTPGGKSENTYWDTISKNPRKRWWKSNENSKISVVSLKAKANRVP